MSEPPDETRILWLLAAVQFVNILEFMMVMPLGPGFTEGLGAAPSDVGYIAASYTAAAAVSGLVGAFTLDRFDRKKALFVAMVGLVLGTFAGGLAPSFHALMVARMVAGVFGGPATSLTMSIVADIVPPERRGRAMGVLLTGFSVASVVGVPGALELARLASWRAPFLVVAVIGLFVSVGALRLLPSMTGHLAGRPQELGLVDEARSLGRELLGMATRPLVLGAWVTSFSLFVGSFVIIPNIATFVQYNLGFPAKWLGVMYMIGGVVSFGVVRLVGFLVDRYGTSRANGVGVVLFIAIIWSGFHLITTWTWVPPIFVAFFVAMGFRTMTVNTQASKVPLPAERARFQSVQSMVQHTAASVAALLSSLLLSTAKDGSLVGMDRILVVSTVFNLALTPLTYAVERGLRARDAATPRVEPSAVPAPSTGPHRS